MGPEVTGTGPASSSRGCIIPRAASPPAPARSKQASPGTRGLSPCAWPPCRVSIPGRQHNQGYNCDPRTHARFPEDGAPSNTGPASPRHAMAEPRPDDLTVCLLTLAAEQPSAVALLAPGHVAMSFGELGCRIRAVGARLRAWGIDRGDIVAWTTDARAESAAALAIMPVAATLAPLDPRLTAEAYVALLQRLKPKAVAVPAGSDHPIGEAARRLGIAEISVVPDANGMAGAFDLELSRPRASLESIPVVAPETVYVSATSGTTGRPKLVPHRQRQLLTTVRAMAECLALGPGDVAAHVVPMHLANGIRAAFLLSLVGGGAVACLPVGDVDAFLAAVESGEVTYTSASYTFMRELLQRVDAGRHVRTGRLRLLRVASGRLEPDEIDRLAKAFEVPIVTGLASTESGFVAHQRLPPAARSRGSVGLPLACEIRLVDEQGRTLEPGAIGEIQVRGPQVFAGYFDDPELTARAFAGDWFRMGDLGRFDADGELHVVGRIDDVINRGGEKISPVEIDAVLRTIPGIADAAAFGIPHVRLGEELVAAVVRTPESGLDATSALAQARMKLGPRRAPRHLWFVDALPRNQAGKLLRRSLPEWVRRTSAADGPVAGGKSAPPRSPLETALAGLWSRALGLASPGRDDNFFMLGGDSLRGTQLLDEVSAVFGVAIPVAALFDDAGTIAAMARRIDTERARRTAPAGVLTIPRRAAGATVPLSGTQARAWFLQRLDPGSAAYHEARLWRIDGPLDVGALRTALAAVAVRQPMLRTRFTTVATLPCQVIDPDPRTELEIVTVAPGENEEQRLEHAVRERTLRPFDLAAATPLRWTLFELADGRHALLRVWHHILGDGISAHALHKDLTDAYAAARAGSDPTLPALPIDYADYAVWQAKEQGGAKQTRLLALWKARLADLPVLALPTDFHRPPTPSFHGGRVTSTLAHEAVAAFRALGRKEGATPFIAFLAAFAALLSRLSGDEDLAIGTPVAGRPAPELAEVIGFFANTVVLRADLSGAPTATELLRRMRGRVLEAIEHQDLPFATLVEALGAPRDPSRNPLFQVAFSMVNRDRDDLQLAGAEVRPVAASIEHAKFDLTLTLVESPDRIDAHWTYCADLFERGTIERMSRQYATLVAAMGAHPARPAATLPLMDDATRARVAAAARGPGFEYPAATTIPERFSERARANPGARAVEALDYGSLEAAANRLAQELRTQGVATGAFVAVARRRTADIAVAWLAVLKVGAAYLPIDPEVPPGAPRVHARRRDSDPRDRRRRACHDVRWVKRVRHSTRARCGAHRRPRRRRAGSRRAPGRRGLCHLHVGVHRSAERRGGSASRRAAPRVRHRLRAARPRRHGRADRQPGLRRIDVRILGRAAERRADRADREDDGDRSARAGRGDRGRRRDRAVPDDRAVQHRRRRGSRRVPGLPLCALRRRGRRAEPRRRRHSRRAAAAPAPRLRADRSDDVRHVARGPRRGAERGDHPDRPPAREHRGVPAAPRFRAGCARRARRDLHRRTRARARLPERVRGAGGPLRRARDRSSSRRGAFTAAATWGACATMARSSSSAGATGRSRSAATASSSRRSRRSSRACRRCAPRPSPSAATTPKRGSSSPMSSARPLRVRRRRTSGATCAPSCRSTCCRRRSSGCRRCRSMRAASWTDAHSRPSASPVLRAQAYAWRRATCSSRCWCASGRNSWTSGRSASSTASSRSAGIRCSRRGSSTRSSARPASRPRSRRCSSTTRSPASRACSARARRTSRRPS